MEKKLEAILSIIFGLIGIILWLVPMIGIIICFIGVFLGIKGFNNTSKNIAVSGIVINSIGLILTILRSGFVAYFT